MYAKYLRISLCLGFNYTSFPLEILSLNRLFAQLSAVGTIGEFQSGHARLQHLYHVFRSSTLEWGVHQPAAHD